MNARGKPRRRACYRIGVMLRRRFGAISVAAAFALVGVVSCASPTLPLPPPAIPTIEAGAVLGHYHLTSVRGAEANAIIVIVNRNPAVPGDARVFGSEADANGTWDADIVATQGDVVDITQEYGTTRSASTTVTIR
jgi:hypothetical protein